MDSSVLKSISFSPTIQQKARFPPLRLQEIIITSLLFRSHVRARAHSVSQLVRVLDGRDREGVDEA